jgi:hypothetical protein
MFKQFKHYYRKEARLRMVQSPRSDAARLEVGVLMGRAWETAVSTDNVLSEFRVTGTFPINRNAVP